LINLIISSIKTRELYKVHDGIPLTIQELINYHNAKHKDSFFFVLDRRRFHDPHEVTNYDDMEFEEGSKTYPMLINPLKNENITLNRFYIRKLNKALYENVSYDERISVFTYDIATNMTYSDYQTVVINNPFQLSISSQNYEPLLEAVSYSEKCIRLEVDKDYDPDVDEQINEIFINNIYTEDKEIDYNLEEEDYLEDSFFEEDIKDQTKDDNYFIEEVENIEEDEKIYLNQFITFNNQDNSFYKRFN